MTQQEGAPSDLSSTLDGRDESKFLQAIGLALRARHAVAGHTGVLQSVQGGKSRLVIVASDAGANGLKKYRDKCTFYRVPLVTASDRSKLGVACGRSYTVVVSVTDDGFARMLSELAREIYGGEAFGETSSL